MKPLVAVAPHHLTLVEMTVYYLQVVLYPLIPLRPRRIVEEGGYVAWHAVPEEAGRSDGVYDIEIVVEIDEMVCQTGYAVYIPLYDNGVVCGQEFLRDVILVVHQIYLRVAFVEPLRLLTACDEVYPAHPRRELLHTAEPVAEEAIVAEACLRHPVLSVFLPPGILRKVRLPLRVVHINPRYNKVYIHDTIEFLFMFLLFYIIIPPAFWHA